jgi:hypothetical protein
MCDDYDDTEVVIKCASCDKEFSCVEYNTASEGVIYITIEPCGCLENQHMDDPREM